MRQLSIFFSSLLLLSAPAAERIVYSSAGGAVTVYSVDEDSGKLTEIQSNPGQGLTAISEDKARFYRVGGGMVETYEIGKDGKLSSLGTSPNTARAGYLMLDATQKFLAGSDYGGGKATIWKIGDDRLAIGEPAAVIELEKAAHSSVFSPGNGFLLVPATTPNKVFINRFDASTGALVPADPPYVSGPAEAGSAQQPRHLVFHPKGRIAYTTQERELPGVAIWNWDEEAGSLELVRSIVTIPEGFEGSITTADLHLTPDAKFLYVSNRDLTDRKAVTGNSSIAGFRVDPHSGDLELIGHTHVPQVPRSFAIDEAGEFLYAAGQTADKLEVFRIDPEKGTLESVQLLETGEGPNWVLCLTLE